MTRRSAALLVGLSLGIARVAGAQDERVGLQVSVNTSYDDSASSLAEVRSLLRVLPPQTVEVPTGVSLSRFIVSTYGLGPTDLPETYRLLEAAVMSLNGITDPTRFRAGNSKVPALPKRALTAPNPANLYNLIPKLLSVQVLSGGIDVQTANARVSRSQQLRAGSATVSIDVDLPRQMFDQIASDPIFDGVRARLVSQEVQVRLGDAQAPPADLGGFTSTEFARIRQALASPARNMPLYIVDTGWPDADTRQRSVEALMALLNGVRVRWRLGFPEQLPPLPAWTETYDHCDKVRRAIEQLEAVDTSDAVRTIYVPLSKAQGGDLILRQILVVDYMIRTLGLQLGNVDATPDLIAKAKQWADSELTGYPASITSQLFTTNKAIVEALANVLAKNNQSQNEFFVMNLSWVVVGPVLDVRFPRSLGGVIVAAAGNEPGVNVNTAGIDFAQRSLNDHRVLTVMNQDRSGRLLCHSSEVEQTFPMQMFATGFDGRVDDQTCGTSFAAPRVAFLIAAFQAARSTVPGEPTWNADLFARFLKARAGQVGLAQYVLDPVAFLSQP